MIDHNKRTTLKTLATASAVAISPSVFAFGKQVNQTAASNGEIKLRVEHDSQFGSNYLVIENQSDADTEIAFFNSETIQLPDGVYSLDRLAAKGPILVKANGSKVFSLDDWKRPVKMDSGHSALRFPIRDNIITDHIVIRDTHFVSNNLKPVTLSKAVVYS